MKRDVSGQIIAWILKDAPNRHLRGNSNKIIRRNNGLERIFGGIPTEIHWISELFAGTSSRLNF